MDVLRSLSGRHPGPGGETGVRHGGHVSSSVGDPSWREGVVGDPVEATRTEQDVRRLDVSAVAYVDTHHPPVDWRPGLDAGHVATVYPALEKHPEQRFASAAETGVAFGTSVTDSQMRTSSEGGASSEDLDKAIGTEGTAGVEHGRDPQPIVFGLIAQLVTSG